MKWKRKEVGEGEGLRGSLLLMSRNGSFEADLEISELLSKYRENETSLKGKEEREEKEGKSFELCTSSWQTLLSSVAYASLSEWV